ncbi:MULTISPECIES: HAD family phosphatase [unclassified Pseudomonas]|uniref:HAD family phosphatase n=1 Tax=unclassified Pseudomonas TaxID=196821 RepID=UPI002AC8C7E9|nr:MULTISPECIES: HAD family phosphatase [unclassified Pseudomonas]MEB0047840.1 HAD family phosphatase [Pseudomonas sp. Dout3]MEB0098354.1 HAD family phosphatase [Pseudomonas sp. DC1.2]WPX57139.1 HAD family phosphatase [Pseudomonas sp. DC1.2]
MSHAEALPVAAPCLTAVLFSLSGCLVDFGARAHLQNVATADDAHLTQGALESLRSLQLQQIPCAWLDELPPALSIALTANLPEWVKSSQHSATTPPWPAPNACWQALMALNVERLDGCVLVSGEPRLLQAGLNAGLWTIGLASCGSLCGLAPSEWQALSQKEREHLRGKATVELFGLGAHSVIDHLGELNTCLADINLRRLKGEKP